MDFVSPFIEPVLSCIGKCVVPHICYIVESKKNAEDLRTALEELKARRSDIERRIDTAKREQKQSTNQVECWLKMVRDAEEEGNKIQGMWLRAEEKRCHRFLNCCGTYSISSKAAKLQKKLTDLNKEAEAFDVVATMQSPGRGETIPTQSALLGLQPYVAKVRSYLSGDEAGIIGVWGMGGVGKTTLLKEIYNSLLGKGNLGFDYLIWAVVSKECKLENLQTQIAKNLGLILREGGDANSHASVIYNYLKDKSFLLFLDDIWKAYRLDDIGIPEPRSKQKVVLTTRLEQVCGEMGAREFIIKVECLKPDEAWSLFEKKVSERILSCHPEIERLAREVAEECGGLPLALTIIGQAMSTRRTPQEWEHALTALRKSHVDDILREGEGMFCKLKFSYDSLRDDATRECFLCCSLWPEDSCIKTNDLILCWMGLGFIKNFDSMEEAFNRGHSLIGDLKGACLLESGTSSELNDYELIDCVKMHDVIRDLALWIASDCGRSPYKWVVKSGVGLREVPREAKIWREAERISLMRNDISEVGFPNHHFECPTLSSLMLQSNWKFNIHPGFFQTMHALTYLDLSHTRLEVLPPDVGMLKMLQYLNLSYTKISSLPEELGGLVRLRYLHLGSTPRLRKIPPGVISSLSELQVFNLCKSAYGANDDDVVGSLIDELERVEGGIQALGITLKSAHLLGRLLKSPRLSIWRLLVQRLCDKTSIQLEYNLWPCLKWLQLDSCQQVDVLELIGGVGEEKNSTAPIEFLHLRSLGKLEEIRWRGVVPRVFFGRLRKLVISNSNMLKSVTWAVGLPSLVVLVLQYCDGIEQVVDEEEIKEQGYYDGQVNLTFPSLKNLSLLRLPNFRRICGPGCAFPVLEYVSVYVCPELKKLPFHPQITTTLREFRCSKGWWEGLKWEEEGIKESILPYVTHQD